MRILGVGHFVVHDSGAGVISESGVEFAVSEERLTRTKRDGAYPHNALYMARRDDINIMAASYLDSAQFEIEHHDIADRSRRDRVLGMQRKYERILRNAGVTNFMGHHYSHAAGAFYTSGFEEAIVITYDGGINCEPWLATVWQGNPKGLYPIRKFSLYDGATAAIRYSAVTSLLGFRPIHDEGKVTGLAAKGNPTSEIIDRLSSAFRKVPIPAEYFNGNFGRTFKWLRDLYSDYDIAASIQSMCEEVVLGLIRDCGITPSEHDCILSGGLFANVKLNLKIKTAGFKRLYVYPAMGDEGLAIGAAAAVAIERGLEPCPMKHAFWGPEYDDLEILASLESSGLFYRRVDDIECVIAKLLSEEKIIARFVGRTEFGPRALGNRSIFCQATSLTKTDWLNRTLRRTETMPFAPVTIADFADQLFLGLSGLERCTPFMTTVVPCTNLMKRLSPAAVHVDGTARPQIVTKDTNQSLYRILSEYYSLTGLPTLINTSFNMHGEPIVCSPSDALRCFVNAQLDHLAIGDYIVDGIPNGN